MVKSYAQTICLKNDPRGIEEYKRHHADCWPEVLGALKAVGVLRMKIFLLETRMFMYMETDTASGCVSAMACANATMTRNRIPAMIEHGTKPSRGRTRRPAMIATPCPDVVLCAVGLTIVQMGWVFTQLSVL